MKTTLLLCLLLCSSVYAQTMNEHAPVDVREVASNFQPMKHFTGKDAKQKAHDFIKEHKGILVEDTLKENSYFVVRIPVDKK